MNRTQKKTLVLLLGILVGLGDVVALYSPAVHEEKFPIRRRAVKQIIGDKAFDLVRLRFKGNGQ